MAFPGWRYSKLALLVFGAGLVLGLVVVSVRLPGLARVASLAMALGIAALPVALIADWRRKTPAAPVKRRGKAVSGKRRAATPRRSARRRR
jgi:membrane protein implicated in regulation of membrane protease activity